MAESGSSPDPLKLWAVIVSHQHLPFAPSKTPGTFRSVLPESTASNTILPSGSVPLHSSGETLKYWVEQGRRWGKECQQEGLQRTLRLVALPSKDQAGESALFTVTLPNSGIHSRVPGDLFWYILMDF